MLSRRLKDLLKTRLRAAAWAGVRAYSGLEAARHPTRPHPPAVLLHSFDGYKRFWHPAAHFARTHLPVSVPLFFATETRPMAAAGFTPLLTGPGSFVRRLRRATRQLERQGFRYVLYLQEDMWLTAPLPAEMLTALVGLMEAHRLDVLKLGEASLWTPEIDDIRAHCGPLGPDGLARQFRWFGPHRYAMAHHVSLFRTRFLLETLHVAALFGKERPIQHEVFCSRYLRDRTKSFTEDDRRFRIAVWADAPVIPYVHAADCGRLTAAAAALLDAHGLQALYQPDLEGEVFPTAR